MLDLGECQLLEANNLPSAVYLSPVQTPPPSNYNYFMFVPYGVRQHQMFGCAYPKCKRGAAPKIKKVLTVEKN